MAILNCEMIEHIRRVVEAYTAKEKERKNVVND